MTNLKHGNWNFDSTGLPNNAMDSYWAQDKIRDMRYLEAVGGRVDYDLPHIVRGLEFTIADKQNAGVFLQVYPGVGYYEETYEVPDDWSQSPPAITTMNVTRQVKLGSTLTRQLTTDELSFLTTTIGQLVYLNAYEIENDGNTRNKTKAAQTYAYEVTLDTTFKLEIQPGGLNLGWFRLSSTIRPYSFYDIGTEQPRTLTVKRSGDFSILTALGYSGKYMTDVSVTATDWGNNQITVSSPLSPDLTGAELLYLSSYDDPTSYFAVSVPTQPFTEFSQVCTFIYINHVDI